MKIISSKATLLTALSRIQGIVEKSSIKPLTSNALIEANEKGVYVSATNLQIGMRARYKDIETVEQGRISINARKFFEIIKELPEQNITIYEKENYWIEVSCGKEIKFNVIGLPPEDFPIIIKEESDVFAAWETEKLINMLDLTSFAISRDESKLNICGAFVENIDNKKIRIVATDGYRLAVIDENVGDILSIEEGFIIPYKAVVELQRILTEKEKKKKLFILIKNNSIVVMIGEVELFIRLLEKKFPDYKIILPGDGYSKITVKVNKDILKPALKRIAIISQENKRPVLFTFKENTIHITAEDTELGRVEETLQLEEKASEKFSFCINSMYLLDVVNIINDDIIIEFNKEEENRPIIVKKSGSGNDLRYVIMPMVMD